MKVERKKREYLATFLGDLAKIVFGTLIISQFLAEKPNLGVIITGFSILLNLLAFSLIIYPEDFEDE
jgi:hypothetical protein